VTVLKYGTDREKMHFHGVRVGKTQDVSSLPVDCLRELNDTGSVHSDRIYTTRSEGLFLLFCLLSLIYLYR